jgi:hypothetical protein
MLILVLVSGAIGWTCFWEDFSPRQNTHSKDRGAAIYSSPALITLAVIEREGAVLAAPYHQLPMQAALISNGWETAIFTSPAWSTFTKIG